jgi:hypothetical protein
MKAALVELVRIPSVCDEGAGGYPFGEAIDQTLHKVLQIASGMIGLINVSLCRVTWRIRLH